METILEPVISIVFAIILVLVWWLYVLASIHAKKFAKFSTNINKVLTFLAIFLLVLSICWILVLIFWNPNLDFWFQNNVKIDTKTDNFTKTVEY